MCGIVGYVGERSAVDILVKGLKRLEYRGYDSTGVALMENAHVEIRKSEGKLENVEKIVAKEKEALLAAKCGIGHTRWATHGKPTTQNAHPHRTGHVVLVHNGIIENYQEIKADLVARGHQPQSETDSELFGFLVLEAMNSGLKLTQAVIASFKKIHGACSVVVMSEKEPNVIVGVRNGSPLVAAIDPKGGAFLASDAQPILEYARDVVFLENNDVVEATGKNLKFFDLESGKPIQREATHLDWSVDKIDKQGFSHYMLKEIHEQPAALVDTLNGLLDRAVGDPFPLAQQPGVAILKNASELVIVACGTSYYAALTGKYWIEKFAKIPVSVDLASEFRYREPVIRKGAVVIGISQSGETADTLAVIRDMKRLNVPTLAVTNVRGSTISRDASATFFTSAGPEIGVAATKSFTTQLLTLLVWAGALSIDRQEKLFQEVIELPHLLKSYLEDEAGMPLAVKKAAQGLHRMKGFFFMGRGYSYPIAMEGALKLKEIAYVHAEGYAAGELKHGPIAMIDEEMVVVVLAPKDSWRDKTVSNLEEVKARGAKIVAIGNDLDNNLKALADFWIPLPTLEESCLLPFAMTTVIQLLSFEIALIKGTDVDKPRNLAKSVTVE